jgi:hypothetical protein
LHEEYIAKSIENLPKEKKKLKKLKEEMFLKTEKARSMSGNLSEKKVSRKRKIEADFRNFIEKLNKNTEKKKQIEAALNYSIKLKKQKKKTEKMR